MIIAYFFLWYDTLKTRLLLSFVVCTALWIISCIFCMMSSFKLIIHLFGWSTCLPFYVANVVSFKLPFFVFIPYLVLHNWNSLVINSACIVQVKCSSAMQRVGAVSPLHYHKFFNLKSCLWCYYVTTLHISLRRNGSQLQRRCPKMLHCHSSICVLDTH